MKVGDLVRGAYDKSKYRTGVIIRIAHPDQYGSFGEVAHVLWTSTPVGLYRTGPAWCADLEVINESR